MYILMCETHTAGFEIFYKLLDLLKNICTETHRIHLLLDYIITRKDHNISDFPVSDLISDHRVLHASLQFIRSHPSSSKLMAVKAPRGKG